MTIYTPNESSDLADTKYAVFKNISSGFVTKNKKEYKKEYKEYNFGVQRVHPLFVLDVCTLLLFFVLEKSGHPVQNRFKIKQTKNLKQKIKTGIKMNHKLKAYFRI
jgi:hypothetical protein